MRSRLALAVVVLASIELTSGRSDAAGPTKAQCVAAYQGAQIDLKSSALAAAREKLTVCLSASCSRALQSDCAEWLKDVEKRQPSVVLSFKGRDGTMLTSVPVTLDGRAFDGKTDGRGVDVDPGERTFVFVPPGEPEVRVTVLVREGERSQRVDAVSSRFVVPKPTPPAPSVVERPIPWSVYAVGGLGVVALGTATAFGVAGIAARGGLSSCRPTCTTDEVSSVRTLFTVADISLVVTVLAAGAATVLYLTRPETQLPAADRTTSKSLRFFGNGLAVDFR